MNSINERTIFLLDGSGALLSSACLGLILTKFQAHIGMPAGVLSLLLLLALCFSVYSLTRYRFAQLSTSFWLKALIAGNLFYCLLSATFLVICWTSLTPLGIGYFVLEKAVVLGIVFLEARVLKKHYLRSGKLRP